MIPINNENKNKNAVQRKRRMRGSALILGLAAVFLIVSGSVLAVLLILNTGAATFNKEKVEFITYQTASYAATYSAFLSDAQKRQTNATDMVNGLLQEMGMNGTNTTVSVSDTTLSGQPAVSVTVTVDLPTVAVGNFASIFPQRIQSTSTAARTKDPYAEQYIVGIDPFDGKVVGAQVNPIGSLPNDGTPAWNISITGVRRIR